MLNALLKRAFASVLGRWVTGIIVTSLLGGAVWMWHNHKENLKDDGYQECVQEISRAQLEQLERALADERSAAAELRANLAAAAAAEREAILRRNALQDKLEQLNREREKQKNEDEEYRTWSASELPAGVADRLRAAAEPSADNPN